MATHSSLSLGQHCWQLFSAESQLSRFLFKAGRDVLDMLAHSEQVGHPLPEEGNRRKEAQCRGVASVRRGPRASA